MEVLPPFQELLPFLAGLIAAGAVAGFLAGLFGIGGGAVLVPVFYQMLTLLHVDESVRMHVCVGTSLGIIVPTSLRSYMSHLKRGAVDTALVRSFLFSVPAGVIAASIIAAWISGDSLKIIFAVVAVAVAIKLLFGRASWKLGTQIPGNPIRSVIGFLIGFFSTFMGIGGGIFNNTFMTLYGRQMLQSVATSAGVGVLISIPGVLGYIWAGWGAPGLPPLSLGFVNVLMMAVVIPMTLVVAPLGVAAAHSLPKRALEIGFGLFMLFVAFRFLVSIFS
jgi:uncharacterized membrane protein YfcA